MTIALIQTGLVWENPEANRKRLERQIDSVPKAVDLIVLPEMFSTGFSMNPERIAETMQGQTAAWMKAVAIRNKIAVTGSLVISENGRFYNRLLFVFPDGEVKTYDKRHLFSLAGEDKAYAPGHSRVIIEYKDLRICPLVCYDLRFPVFSRNTEDFDLLLYVANWPEQRILAWDALLKARAIENMCYTVGVNRVGQDANGHRYTGHSQAVDFLGDYVVAPMQGEGISIVELDKESMLETRKKLGFLNDRDAFTIG